MAIPFRPEFHNPKSAFITMELELGGFKFDVRENSGGRLRIANPQNVPPGVGRYTCTINGKVEADGKVYIAEGISEKNPIVVLSESSNTIPIAGAIF